MNKDKDMDIKLIRFMIDNQELSPSTMKFLINYLLDSIETDWKDKNEHLDNV